MRDAELAKLVLCVWTRRTCQTACSSADRRRLSYVTHHTRRIATAIIQDDSYAINGAARHLKTKLYDCCLGSAAAMSAPPRHHGRRHRRPTPADSLTLTRDWNRIREGREGVAVA